MRCRFCCNGSGRGGAALGLGLRFPVHFVGDGVAFEIFLHCGGLVAAPPVFCVPFLEANSCVVVSLGVAVVAT